MIFGAFPEEQMPVIMRDVHLYEHINQTLYKESIQNKNKSICYIVVSHGHFPNNLAHLMNMRKENAELLEK